MYSWARRLADIYDEVAATRHAKGSGTSSP
jgi:hypothetical protein